MNDRLIIGLGSNLSPRQKYLQEAQKKLKQVGKITEISSRLETEPWGVETENEFLNQVIVLENCRYDSPQRLMELLLGIEKEIGRRREVNAPDRVIDIDILYWGNRVTTAGVVIPHPRLHRRRFVLRSLVEIMPRFVHPVLKKTQQQLLDEID